MPAHIAPAHCGNTIVRNTERGVRPSARAPSSNERGNDESVYAIRIRDSNERPQYMAGYAYQWVFPVVSKYEVSAGLTALLIRRHDWFEGRPFPAVLPVASFGTHKAQLTATYVPHLSMRKGKGNIVLLMLKMSL